MMEASKILKIVGFLLILLAITLKLGGAPCIIGTTSIRLLSLLVVANICFVLAILFKK